MEADQADQAAIVEMVVAHHMAEEDRVTTMTQIQSHPTQTTNPYHLVDLTHFHHHPPHTEDICHSSDQLTLEWVTNSSVGLKALRRYF